MEPFIATHQEESVESSSKQAAALWHPEQVPMGEAANQTPAHATVCKRAVAGKAAAQWDQSA